MKQLISDPQNWLCFSVMLLCWIVILQGRQIKLLNKKIESIELDSLNRDVEIAKQINDIVKKVTELLK